MITTATAPRLARKIAKSVVFTQQQIRKASNAEAKGIPGATEEREKLSADFARLHGDCVTAITMTRATAASMDRAALIMRGGITDTTTDDPLSLLAAFANRLGADTPALTDLCREAASRGNAAADAAEDRLDDTSDDIEAVALQIQIAGRMKATGYDRTHPSIKPLHNEFLMRSDAAKKRRMK